MTEFSENEGRTNCQNIRTPHYNKNAVEKAYRIFGKERKKTNHTLISK